MTTDREVLIWVHQRLVHVHGEPELVDYMHALRDVISRTPKGRKNRGIVVNARSNEVLNEIRARYGVDGGDK